MNNSQQKETTQNKTSSGMNWGKWIIVSFALFAIFIATLVTVCMRQEVNLVSKDYYQEELQYQKRIECMQNTAALSQPPVISIEAREVKIHFERFAEIRKGQLNLFCPANPRNDRVVTIAATAAGKQTIPINNLQPGMYHAKFSWTMAGKDYYMDSMINL